MVKNYCPKCHVKYSGKTSKDTKLISYKDTYLGDDEFGKVIEFKYLGTLTAK